MLHEGRLTWSVNRIIFTVLKCKGRKLTNSDERVWKQITERLCVGKKQKKVIVKERKQTFIKYSNYFIRVANNWSNLLLFTHIQFRRVDRHKKMHPSYRTSKLYISMDTLAQKPAFMTEITHSSFAFNFAPCSVIPGSIILKNRIRLDLPTRKSDIAKLRK